MNAEPEIVQAIEDFSMGSFSQLGAQGSDLAASAQSRVLRVGSAIPKETVMNRFEGRSVLVTGGSSGIGKFAKFPDEDEAFRDQIFDTNVKGADFQVQALLPLLNRGASIVIDGSAISGGDTRNLVYSLETLPTAARPLR